MTGPAMLYVASSNAGKLRDFARAAENFVQASGAGFTLALLPGLAGIAPPVESANTFEGNAVGKAVYYSRHAPGSLVLADDSGLEVDALNGAPGVYSARFAARAGTPTLTGAALDAANNQHLLAELARVLAPADTTTLASQASAQYRCVLAVARDSAWLASAEGTVEGSILLAPRGSGGFGYDPLFYLPALGQTMAELDASTRLGLSHRGAALRALLPKLADVISP